MMTTRRSERGDTHPVVPILTGGLLVLALALVALVYWAYNTRNVEVVILVFAGLFLACGLLSASGKLIDTLADRRQRRDERGFHTLWPAIVVCSVATGLLIMAARGWTVGAISLAVATLVIAGLGVFGSQIRTAPLERSARSLPAGPRVLATDPSSPALQTWHPNRDLWADRGMDDMSRRLSDTKNAIDRRASRRRGDRGDAQVEMLLVPIGTLVLALIFIAVVRWAFLAHGLTAAAAIVAGLLVLCGLPVAIDALTDWAQRRRDERGSHTLQMAIIVPLMLLLIFTIFQAAMYYWAKSVASAAARQGATAVSREDAASSDGATRAREFLDSPSGDVLRGAEISVDWDATAVSVTVEGSAVGPIPGLWHVSQTSTMPIEEFTTDEDVAN